MQVLELNGTAVAAKASVKRVLDVQRLASPAGLYTLTPLSQASLHYRAAGYDQLLIGPPGKEVVLFAGGYVYVPPNCGVSIRCPGEVVRWRVLFDHDFAVTELALTLPAEFQNARHDAALDCYFKLLSHHLQDAQALISDHAEVLEKLMIFQVSRIFGRPGLNTDEGNELAQIMRLGQFVEQKLAYALGVEDMAMHLEVSKFRLLRLLRKALDTSPQQFLIDRRMARAKQLLLETELSLTDIAMRTGFSSQSHFTTSFGNLNGLSPGAFRQTNRQ